MNIILIGPQGSGKGTQAQKIIEKFHLNHIETGKLIREKAEQHSKKAEIIDHLANQKGKLLPDGVVIDLLFEELEKIGFNNLLFDGFPRTTNQYLALKEILAQKNSTISNVIYLSLTDEEALKRLMARRVCSKCSKSYSLLLEPDRTTCECGGQLISREDDNQEAIKKRLISFHKQTAPVLDAAKQDNILVEIDASKDIDEIFKQLSASLSEIPTNQH